MDRDGSCVVLFLRHRQSLYLFTVELGIGDFEFMPLKDQYPGAFLCVFLKWILKDCFFLKKTIFYALCYLRNLCLTVSRS